MDASGNIYIEDAGNNRIRMVSNGVITTVAGGGTGDDGPATGAHLNFQNMGPGMTLDRAGNIYFADDSNGTRIRKMSNGTISTVAGGDIRYPTIFPPPAPSMLKGGSGLRRERLFRGLLRGADSYT